MFTPSEILGPGGRIAARLPNYEHRDSNSRWPRPSIGPIREQHHLAVEAGTGVGKSFAYLVPAILAVAGEAPIKPRPVVAPNVPARPPVAALSIGATTGRGFVSGEGCRSSRGGFHAHDQPARAIDREGLPLLSSVMPLEFSAVLVKGRSNYLSLRRLENAMSRAAGLFSEPEEFDELRRLHAWSKETADGSLADLDFRPLPAVWDEVASDHGNCMGRECPMYGRLLLLQGPAADATRADSGRQSRPVLHRPGAAAGERQLLPKYDVVILDEAHTIEAVAGDHLGLNIGSGQIEYTLRKLYNDRTNRGLLVHHKLRNAQKRFGTAASGRADFFDRIAGWLEEQPQGQRPRPAAEHRRPIR